MTMTSLTFRGARISVLGLLASLAASPLAAQKLGTTEYTLRPGSVILDRCLDCGPKRSSAALFFEKAEPRCYPRKTDMYRYF